MKVEIEVGTDHSDMQWRVTFYNFDRDVEWEYIATAGDPLSALGKALNQHQRTGYRNISSAKIERR